MFYLSGFVCFASQTPGLFSVLISLRLPYPVCTRFFIVMFVCFPSQMPVFCSASLLVPHPSHKFVHFISVFCSKSISVLFSLGLFFAYDCRIRCKYSLFSDIKGNFKGEHFDSASPPQRLFCNHKSCVPFAKFISDTILQCLSRGAILVWGKVGEVDPPHLVSQVLIQKELTSSVHKLHPSWFVIH